MSSSKRSGPRANPSRSRVCALQLPRRRPEGCARSSAKELPDPLRRCRRTRRCSSLPGTSIWLSRHAFSIPSPSDRCKRLWRRRRKPTPCGCSPSLPRAWGSYDWNATIVKPLATARSNSVVHRIEFIQDDGGPARYPKTMTQLEKVIYCIAEAARNVGHDRRDAFHIAIDPHDGLHSRQSETSSSSSRREPTRTRPSTETCRRSGDR